jgi:hypothetical protein
MSGQQQVNWVDSAEKNSSYSGPNGVVMMLSVIFLALNDNVGTTSKMEFHIFIST